MLEKNECNNSPWSQFENLVFSNFKGYSRSYNSSLHFARVGWYLWPVFNNAQEILVMNTVNSLLQLKTFMLCDDTKYNIGKVKSKPIPQFLPRIFGSTWGRFAGELRCALTQVALCFLAPPLPPSIIQGKHTTQWFFSVMCWQLHCG